MNTVWIAHLDYISSEAVCSVRALTVWDWLSVLEIKALNVQAEDSLRNSEFMKPVEVYTSH